MERRRFRIGAAGKTRLGPNVGWDVEEDTLANADSWQSTTFPVSELGYACTPGRAGCIKQIVFAQAGATL